MGFEEDHREPLTPPSADLLAPQHASPSYDFHSAPSAKWKPQYDFGFDGICRLENVQDAHVDGSPVFAFDADMPYQCGFQG